MSDTLRSTVATSGGDLQLVLQHGTAAIPAPLRAEAVEACHLPIPHSNSESEDDDDA